MTSKRGSRRLVFERRVAGNPHDFLESFPGFLNESVKGIGVHVFRDMSGGPRGFEEMGLHRHVDYADSEGSHVLTVHSEFDGAKRGDPEGSVYKHVVSVFLFGAGSKASSLSRAVKSFFSRREAGFKKASVAPRDEPVFFSSDPDFKA